MPCESCWRKLGQGQEVPYGMDFPITYVTRDVVFDLTDCVAEPAYCTTTDKRRKRANPLNNYMSIKKGGKLGNNQVVFISVIGGSHSNLCVFKFFVGVTVKGFGKDVKETGYVATFIIKMSIRDSLLENMKGKA